MGALGAIEEVFLLALLGFGGGGVGNWVGDLRGFAVGAGKDGVV